MDRTWLLVVTGCLLAPAVGCIPDSPAASGGGVASAADGKKCPPDGVIDDSEDGNNNVSLKKGRNGYWYTFLDKAGSTITPANGVAFPMAAGGANGSTHAAHASGKIGGGAIVYAGMGLNFVDPKGVYDASAYKGVSFFAKAAAPIKIRLKVPDGDTDPDGKVCTECFNDFGQDIDLTTAWTKYVVTFASMSQLAGWGAPHPSSIDSSKLFGLQFQVNSPGADYDIWVDDIEFTGCP
jgi:endoglucanase